MTNHETTDPRPDADDACDVLLLDEAEVDPEVADVAAEAVKREWRRRHWTRRRDVDYGDRP